MVPGFQGSRVPAADPHPEIPKVPPPPTRARRLISLRWPISFFSIIAVVVFVHQHLFVFAEDYFNLEHESTEKDVQGKENTSSQARAKRHIGVPDHGGYQRLMATGSIMTSLGEENNTGPADSIDIVFTTYWQYPAKVRIILPEDKACIEDFRKRHNITGKLTASSSSSNDGDGYQKVTSKVSSRCFKLHHTYAISFNSKCWLT